MANNLTFSMLKPGMVDAGHVGGALKMIEDAGFKILALRLTKMTKERAGQFYEVHKDRPFYDDLCTYMSSGTIVAIALQKDNAVDDFRALIGPTDATKAEPGTIRHAYGESMQKNAVHGSDSDENAAIEASFFFPKTDIFA